MIRVAVCRRHRPDGTAGTVGPISSSISSKRIGGMPVLNKENLLQLESQLPPARAALPHSSHVAVFAALAHSCALASLLGAPDVNCAASGPKRNGMR